MKRALLYLLLLCCDSAIYAQSINMDSIFEPKLRGEIYQEQTGFEGNQFFNDNWAISDIKLSTGELVSAKQLKYNMLLDEVIWLPSGSFRQVKLEKHFIDEFWFRNYKGKAVRFKRIWTKLPAMIDSTDIFVEVLSEKAACLQVFRSVRIEGGTNNLDGVQYSVKNLSPQPVYILAFPDRQTISFRKISKRVLLKIIPETYKVTVKSILEQNHLSIRTENDLTKLVDLIQI